MTVAEMIEELKKMPQDSLVVVWGYGGGYDNLQIYSDYAILNDNWNGESKKYRYYGRHGLYCKEMGEIDKVSCVVVGRSL